MDGAIEKIGGVLFVVGIGHDFLKYEKNMLPHVGVTEKG